MDVDLNGVAFHILLPAIELFLQNRFGKDHAGVLHERMDDREFTARQGNDAVGPLRHHLRRIERHAQCGQRPLRTAFAPADDGPQAGGDFVQIERLAQIIVGTGIEAGNLVRGRVLRRQQQDRHPVPLIASVTQKIEAGTVWQHQVENDGVETAAVDSRFRIFKGRDGIDGEAGKLQPDTKTIQQDIIVLDH